MLIINVLIFLFVGMIVGSYSSSLVAAGSCSRKNAIQRVNAYVSLLFIFSYLVFNLSVVEPSRRVIITLFSRT